MENDPRQPPPRGEWFVWGIILRAVTAASSTVGDESPPSPPGGVQLRGRYLADIWPTPILRALLPPKLFTHSNQWEVQIVAEHNVSSLVSQLQHASHVHPLVVFNGAFINTPPDEVWYQIWCAVGLRHKFLARSFPEERPVCSSFQGI